MITKFQLGMESEEELENLRVQLHEQINPGCNFRNFHRCTQEEMQIINSKCKINVGKRIKILSTFLILILKKHR